MNKASVNDAELEDKLGQAYADDFQEDTEEDVDTTTTTEDAQETEDNPLPEYVTREELTAIVKSEREEAAQKAATLAYETALKTLQPKQTSQEPTFEQRIEQIVSSLDGEYDPKKVAAIAVAEGAKLGSEIAKKEFDAKLTEMDSRYQPFVQASSAKIVADQVMSHGVADESLTPYIERVAAELKMAPSATPMDANTAQIIADMAQGRKLRVEGAKKADKQEGKRVVASPGAVQATATPQGGVTVNFEGADEFARAFMGGKLDSKWLKENGVEV